MRNLRRAAAIFAGVVGAAGVAAALVVGCGGDDTIVGVGGGDSGNDVNVTGDTSPPDTGTSDTGVTDGSGDEFYFDAGPPNLAQFYLQINETGCARLQNCCTNGEMGYDGGFDLNACLTTFDPANGGGFLYTSPVQDPIDGGGNVTLDQSKASLCLSLISGLSCTAPFTSSQMKAIRDACNSAVIGNIPAGSTGCQATIECASPAHCEPTAGGTCVNPYTTGSGCVFAGDTDLQSLERCGRPYTGNPGYCEIGDFQTVLEAGTCAGPAANGADCASPFECQSWLCDLTDTSKCVDSAQIFTPGNSGLCSAFSP